MPPTNFTTSKDQRTGQKKARQPKALYQYNARLESLAKQLDNLRGDYEAKKMALTDYLEEATLKAAAQGVQYESDSESDSEFSKSKTKREKGPYDAYTLAERHELGQVFQDWVLRRSLRAAHRPFERLPCANSTPVHPTEDKNSSRSKNNGHCENEAKLTCAQCRLVSYCSKECQRSHWKEHKKDCKHPLRASDWKPSWMTEDRRPNFGMNGPRIWSNIPATDTLNLPKNELKNDTTPPKKLALAYIGSADLRNVVRTVNSLPPTFSGDLTILLNAPPQSQSGQSPSRTLLRSILILLTLQSVVTDIDQAAEIALHLWTSAFVRSSHGHVHRRIAGDFGNAIKVAVLDYSSLKKDGRNVDYVFDIGLGEKSAMKGVLSRDTIDLLKKFQDHEGAFDEATEGYKEAKFGPASTDRHERAYCRLEPSHRQAYSVQRASGHTYPFGGRNVIHIPNRTLFSPSGQWLQDDLAYPLDEWNIEEVIATGLEHGCQSADIFGCLYFYLSEQLRTFIRRLRKFSIAFKFFEKDPHELARQLTQGIYAPLGLARDTVFDRIDVSNIADYNVDGSNGGGLSNILKDWAPLLNENNLSSTILAYSDNWVSTQRKSHPGPVEMQALTLQLIKKGRLDAQKMQPELIPVWLKYFVALYDNSAAFEEYLAKEGVNQAAEKAGLRRKTKHTVVPQRIGVEVGDPPNALPRFPTDESWYWRVQVSQVSFSERFVEFEVAR